MPELHSGDPRRLGSYQILERLGEGGQGVVYLGQDDAGGKVAIKLLRADLTEDETARSRFVREVQAAKQVARFCTAQVLEADVAGDRPYIVSEFVPGKSLQKLVTEEGPRSGAALDRLAIGTTTALVAIHQAGIVHRDLKPHNVLMAPDGPRVIDFGIARALDPSSTAATKAIGTPAYMSPEQVMGAKLTEAVDIFSWASTMVFAAAGHPPFGQDTIPAVINRLLNEPPDLEGVPEDLRELLSECLAKDPQARPTAQALMMRLIGGGTPASGLPVEEPTRLDQPAATDATRVAGPEMAAAMGAAAAAPRDELPTTVLAEGQQIAGRSTGPAGPQAPGGVTLPGVPGYPTPPGGSRSPGHSSKGPLIATVAGVAAVLLLIAGLVYATRGGDSPTAPATPSVTVSATTEDPGDQQPPPEDSGDDEAPEQTATAEPTQQPTGTGNPVPTAEPEPSDQPTRPEPTGSPSDDGGGNPDDGGGGSTGDPGDGDTGGGDTGGGGGGTGAGPATPAP